MKLTGKALRHLSTVTHDTKVLLFGIDTNGTIWYTVKQEGFEDTSLDAASTNDTGFEEWKKLNLDRAVDDPSAREHIRKEMSTNEGNVLLNLHYGSVDATVKTAQAPIRLVSGMKHLYTFRVSAAGKLLVNRFILDGMKNELVPKLEVRYRRSGQKYQPDSNMGTSDGGGLQNVDTLGFRDIDGKAFYEPATELSFIENLSAEKPWFAVVLLPTQEKERHRWNIFAYDSTLDKIVLYSVRSSEEGLFDLKDFTLSLPDINTSKKVLTHRPGLIKRTIDLQNHTIENSFDATSYAHQAERSTKAGLQLLKESIQVMLAVPVKKTGETQTTTAAVSFAAAIDGTLSQIDLVPNQTDKLRGKTKEILLPLNTLDEIQVIADSTPTPSGKIMKMGMGSNDHVRVYSATPTTGVKTGNRIKVSGTKSYDGHYLATQVSETEFEIEATFKNNEPGYWEVKEEKETGLVFDDMVVAYEKTEEGKLKIKCTSHTLQEGDEVQVSGTALYDGIYPVKQVGTDNSFLLDLAWTKGKVLNLKTTKRRGFRFDGEGDYVRTAGVQLEAFKATNPNGRSLSAWVWLQSYQDHPQLIVAQDDQCLDLQVDSDNKVQFKVRFADNTFHHVKDPDELPLRTWVHYAGVVDYKADESGGKTHLYLCKDGAKVIPTALEGETITDNEKIVPTLAPYHLQEGLLTFDGTDDYIKTDTREIGFSEGASAEAWVFMDDSITTSNSRAILTEKKGSNVSFALQVTGGTDNQLAAGFHDGSNWQLIQEATTFPKNQWVHVAATYDGKRIRLYRDGAEVKASDSDLDIALPAGNNEWYIGKRHDNTGGGHKWKGKIADVRLWNTVRGATQIRDNRFRRWTGRVDGLTGYWPLEQNGQLNATDLSGFGRHGTLQGDMQKEELTFRHPEPALAEVFELKSGTIRTYTETVTRIEIDTSEESYTIPKMAQFSKGGEYMSIEDRIMGTHNSFTQELWIYLPAISSQVTGLLSLMGGGMETVYNPRGEEISMAKGFCLYIKDRNKLEVGFRGRGNDGFPAWHSWTTTRSVLTENAWNHVAVTFSTNSAEYRIYVNAVLVETIRTSTYLPDSNAISYIGRFDNSGHEVNIGVQEVRIWSTVRSLDQIRSVKNRRLTGNEEGLLGYFRFDDQELGEAVTDHRGVSRASLTNKADSNKNGRIEASLLVNTSSTLTFTRTVETEREVEEQVERQERVGSGAVIIPNKNLPEEKFTLAFWLKTDETHSSDATIGLVAATDNYTHSGDSLEAALDNCRFALYIREKLNVAFPASNHTKKQANLNEAVNDGKWHHIVLCWESEGGKLRVYKDGKEIYSDTGFAEGYTFSQATEGALIIGKLSHYFVGVIGQVSLWSDALPEKKIQEMQGQRLSGDETGLEGLWAHEGSKACDLSHRQKHGVFHNNPKPGKIDSLADQPVHPHLLVGGNGTENYFDGKIADIQCWDAARSEQTIKDTMHLYLQGNEKGLAGNWRLGGIAPEKDYRITPDLSVHKRDARVYGDVYVSACELSRNNKLGKAVKYSNEALVAVSRGATYRETFEFRVHKPDNTYLDLAGLNNADGAGNKIFRCAYWGKRSRTAEKTIKFPEGSYRMNDFTVLTDGWHKATCTFTVPDEVSMIRSFELSDIRGRWTTNVERPADEWDHIQVRKHRIALISDAISQEQYTDALTLTPLADNQTSLETKLKELSGIETDIIDLREELLEVKEKIQAIDSKEKFNREKTNLETAITRLRKEKTTEVNRKNEIDSMPSKYIFTLWGKQSDKVLDVHKRRDDNAIIYTHRGTKNQQWVLEKEGTGTYRIKSMYNNGYLDSTTVVAQSGDNVKVYTHKCDTQLWSFAHRGGEYYALRNEKNNAVLDVAEENTSDRANVKLWDPHYRNNQLWKIKNTDKLAPHIDQELKDLGARLDNIETDLSSKQKRLARVNRILEAVSGYSQEELDDIKTTLETRETTLEGNITTRTTLFDNKSATFLTSLTANQQSAQSMPQLQQDRRKLVTRGATLGFARPTSGITMQETAEGNVQLSYFDDKGRMRLSNYDATADSRNATYQQWLPQSLRACIDFRNSGSKMSLPEGKAFDLKQNQWSVEAWCYYPGTYKSDNTPYLYNALTTDTAGHDHTIAIREGKRLGTVVNDFFYYSGYSLEENLDTGWRHIAAIGRDGVTKFYVDGRPVGDHEENKKALTRYAMEFDGIDDRIKLPAINADFSNGLTVAAWVYYEEFADWSTIIDLANGKKSDNILLANEGTTNTLVCRIYRGSSYKYMKKADILETGRWMHIAFTIDDDGNGTLYVDGKEAHFSGEMQTPNTVNRTKNYIGKNNWTGEAFFKGKISGVSLWNTCRSADDIQKGMYTILQGNETGLIGYWPMNLKEVNGEKRIEDRCTSKKDTGNNEIYYHGEIDSDPVSKALDAQSVSDIAFIGNAKDGGSPFGKLSEVRIWDIALSDEEVAVNSKINLGGYEPGLVRYYPFIEGQGNEARDHTVSDQVHGALSGTPKWVANTLQAQYPVTRAMKFNGSSSYIEIPGFKMGGDELTIEYWFKGTRVQSAVRQQKGDDYIIAASGTDSPEYSLSNNDDRLSCGGLHDNRTWYHMAMTWEKGKTGGFAAYLNNIMYGTTHAGDTAIPDIDAPLIIGGKLATSTSDGTTTTSISECTNGMLAEVRIWNKVRTRSEINACRNKQLSGLEEGLIGYWRLDGLEDGLVKDLSPGQHHGTLHNVEIEKTEGLALAVAKGQELVTAEYSTVDVAAGKKTAIMRRFMALSDTVGQISVLPEQRIEELEFKWIGNAQFAPTLLGYIEGAPPVPSENLTVSHDYNGATSVQLSQSKDTSYSWMRSTDASQGLDLSMFLGVGWGLKGGLGLISKISEGKAGLRGMLNMRIGTSKQSTVRSDSSETLTDRLELRGARENTPRFEHLGNRYVPKNVGYALVVSGLADVFILRMRRTGKMVAYKIAPVEDMPMDVNTITFMMNPTYTLNGSLDGLVGSEAADERFYRQVPEMRAQYGSLYPASYYKLKEAYHIKKEIDRLDKEREAYFTNFDVSQLSLGEHSLDDQTADTDDADQYGQVSTGDDPGSADKSSENKKESREEAGDRALAKGKENAQAQKATAKEKAKAREEEIKKRQHDPQKQTQALNAFDAWQRRMENLQIQAGKRNIANTYVWDADGGLRSEEQSFATTIEHTIGGSFSLSGAIGAELDVMIAAFKLELTALYQQEVTQTMSKTLTTSSGFSLDVDLNGLESNGITDQDDYPMQPGEKVDRYRFMSFYLEGNTRNFHHFFNEVVDPEWLLSNDEEARALREAMAGNPNKAWRVLHRVTYVERPALLGIGTDRRDTDTVHEAAEGVLDYLTKAEDDSKTIKLTMNQLQTLVAQLTGKVDAVTTKVDQLLENGESTATDSAS